MKFANRLLAVIGLLYREQILEVFAKVDKFSSVKEFKMN